MNAADAEVLAVYEDEVVQLQQQVLQEGAERGLPGLMYQLADLQVSRQGEHVYACTIANALLYGSCAASRVEGSILQGWQGVTAAV